MKKLVLLTLVFGASACANTFATTYKGTGAASEALDWSKRSQARYESLEGSKAGEDAAMISGVRIYVDSVPGELTVDGDTIGVKEGVDAELVGQVHVIASLKVPSPEQAIPALQKAAYAGGANLAYCPTEGLGHRCYLVRTAEVATEPDRDTTL